MDQRYSIANPEEVLSPGLVVFEEIVRENLERMKEIAGEAGRLRPHCKTHKMIDVVRMEVEMGILKHKCATFAEAEMLALGGARDVFLAYNLVGPNIDRAVRYRQRFPEVRFSVAADHPEPVAALNDAMAQAANQLILLFQPLANISLMDDQSQEPEPSAESQVPLEDLNLSVRAYNCLKRAQVNSLSDLMAFSYEDLLEIKNFGAKSADEVIEALERIGVSLPQNRANA